MEWLTVITLIGIGIVLLIVELVLVPGTTLVGILGLLLTGAGIAYGYMNLGSTTGHFILAGTILVGTLAVIFSLRTGAWDKFALKNRNDSRVNQDQSQVALQPGEEGKAVSALRPMGTALFQERHIEVQTKGNFVAAGTPIRVLEVRANRIIVEPIA